MTIEFSKPVCFKPQWAEQDTVLVGWPRLREEWGKAYNGAKQEIGEFITQLSKFLPVIVTVGDLTSYQEVRSELGSRVDVLKIPLGDIWLRDTAPLIGRDQNDQWVGLLPNFNFWGGKFDMPGDTDTAQAICQYSGLIQIDTMYDGDNVYSRKILESNTNGPPLVLEGGAIELNGQGHAILAKPCILNPNRNPKLSQKSIEQWFTDVLGVDKLIWLEEGLGNDHTDGHVDNTVRFVSSDHLVCQTSMGEDDPNHKLFMKIESWLLGSGLKVTKVPSPGLVLDETDRPLPASHLNFLISNGVVIVPIYENTFSKKAIRSIETAFPSHEVIGLPANSIIRGGGAFHCMTRDIPLGVMK